MGSRATKQHTAYKSEYKSQVVYSTFTIRTLHYNFKAIKRKRVFKLKENLNGLIEKYKAKQVTKDY